MELEYIGSIPHTWLLQQSDDWKQFWRPFHRFGGNVIWHDQQIVWIIMIHQPEKFGHLGIARIQLPSFQWWKTAWGHCKLSRHIQSYLGLQYRVPIFLIYHHFPHYNHQFEARHHEIKQPLWVKPLDGDLYSFMIFPLYFRSWLPMTYININIKIYIHT